MSIVHSIAKFTRIFFRLLWTFGYKMRHFWPPITFAKLWREGFLSFVREPRERAAIHKIHSVRSFLILICFLPRYSFNYIIAEYQVLLYHFFLFTSNPPNPFCFLIFICCSAFARRMLQKWGKKTLTEVRSEEKWWFFPYKKQKMQCKKTLTNRWIKCIYTIKLLETSTRVKKNVRWNESNFCVYFVDFVVAFAITGHIYQQALIGIPQRKSFCWRFYRH